VAARDVVVAEGITINGLPISEVQTDGRHGLFDSYTGAEIGRYYQTCVVGRLPACFNGCGLSYHDNPSRWALDDQGVLLRTVGRGQEFVTQSPAVVDWALNVVEGHR